MMVLALIFVDPQKGGVGGEGRKTTKGEREGERPFSLSLSNPF